MSTSDRFLLQGSNIIFLHIAFSPKKLKKKYFFFYCFKQLARSGRQFENYKFNSIRLFSFSKRQTAFFHKI